MDRANVHVPSKDPNSVKIVVFNPHPWVRSDIIYARFSERGNTSNLILLDEENMKSQQRSMPWM